MKHVNKYFLYDILGMTAYSLVLYFGFTWLAGFSLLFASLWSFALIVIAVAFDEYSSRIMQSDETMRLMKEKYSAERVKRIIAGGFLSFKSLIYLFYVFLLIAAQVIEFFPASAGQNIAEFIRANDYSIVFLLAVDTFMGQLAKDKERTKKLSEKFNEASLEDKTDEIE